MRDYSIVSAKFWIGETGKRLRGDRDAQLLALYLITSPHASMSGLYYCPILYMAQDTGLPSEGARKGLQSLIDVGFCEYDEGPEMVFVAQMARFQIGETLGLKDNRRTGLLKEIARLPKTALILRFFERYAAAYTLGEADLPKDLRGPFGGANKPLGSLEQEQEQEQEGRISPEPSPGSAPASVPLALFPPPVPEDGADEPPVGAMTERQQEALAALRQFPFRIVRWQNPEGTAAEVLGAIKTHDLARDLGGDGFPGVAVRQTVAQAASWTKANPTRAKTPAGLRKFLTDWFAREQNRGRGGGAAPPSPPSRRGGDLLAKVREATGGDA